jgi:Flp pilus assembly pilin Flp
MERALREEGAQDLIEYALLMAFISIIAIAAITSIGAQVDAWYVGFGATVSSMPAAS